jgi:hypothetical protein
MNTCVALHASTTPNYYQSIRMPLHCCVQPCYMQGRFRILNYKFECHRVCLTNIATCKGITQLRHVQCERPWLDDARHCTMQWHHQILHQQMQMPLNCDRQHCNMQGHHNILHQITCMPSKLGCQRCKAQGRHQVSLITHITKAFAACYSTLQNAMPSPHAASTHANVIRCWLETLHKMQGHHQITHQ